ncbi:MAG: hypothetical protein HY794_07745 [Desulfarculus sp.]|nr:hypothetical protein [Desulfarculus sp.]
MEFVFAQARLEWQPGQGYRHPHSGQWVATPLEALKGWIVEDAGQRMQWVQLIGAIEEFWKHNQPSQVDPQSVVDFG